MLDYNYDEGTMELMIGITCCRNDNRTEKLEEIWDSNKMVRREKSASLMFVKAKKESASNNKSFGLFVPRQC